MKNKGTTELDLDIYLEMPESRRKNIRKDVCEEFGIKDINRPDLGYQYNNRVCQGCCLWSACMLIGYSTSLNTNNKQVKKHFGLSYFFSESEVLNKAEEYVDKLITIINKKIEEKGFVEESKLDGLLVNITLNNLQTLDPEIPTALKHNILNTGKFTLKNGKICK